MWQERTILLTKLIQPVWVRKREKKRGIGERKEWDFRERSSTFSLGFPAIGPLVFGEARSKVAPHSKGYEWVSVLGSFDKIQKVGVFSYLFLLFG